MRLAAGDVVHGHPGVRRELLGLALAVVLVDALFIAGYFLFRLEHSAPAARAVYTAAWTIVTLAIVIRSLTRIRTLRRRSRGASPG